jgi:hypothetical protein
MALTLKVPTTKTFYFKADDNGTPTAYLRRMKDDETPDCTVVFRQATASEVETRTAALSRRILKRDDDQMVIVNETNLDLVARVEVFLTLGSCDILFPDGNELDFDSRKVKSRRQFDAWWDLMPSQWARELHRCCLETNPDWDGSKS